MKVVAAVLVAGKGERFGGDKALASLGGKPLWRWSFETLSAHPAVNAVGLVCSSENLEEIRREAPQAAFVVQGGSTRKQSSRAALQAMPPDTDVALLHDGARPFVTPKLIGAVIEAAWRAGAAAPGHRPVDTIKWREGSGLATLDRDALVAVQTPQGLKTEVFRKGHALLDDAPDDLALAEAAGITPELVEGDPANVKITLAEDLERAEALLRALKADSPERSAETRTGIGYDIHRFSPDPSRTLWLGGVAFAGERALEGHSDADVLLHAITDALLGAAAMGDIGQHFPNTDLRWRDEPSATFVAFAAESVRARGFAIVNLDATVIAERPKLSGRIGEMRARIAHLASLAEDRVNIKATTNERLGSIGREEGIAAIAIATIRALS